MVTPRKIIYDLVAGDDGPPLEVRFLGLTLSQYSEIKLKVQKADGSRFERDVTPDATDPELGTVTWQASDLTVGWHRAEFQLTRSADGLKFTVPRRFAVVLSVREDLD